MEGLLNVKNLAYVQLKIEKVIIPPSYNLIKHIMLQEGIGYAVPVLQINFMDATGTLQNELSLTPGVVCDITITRDIEQSSPYSGEFSLWGLERYVDSEGPALKALFILNVPKYAAGVYCENFRTVSSDVLAQVAGRGGLRYSGPMGATNDKMNWLNINQTRSSFSEEVAMHGWQSATSCMMRAVTLDKELRYKNIFEELAKSEKATLLLNYPEQGASPIVMRETVDVSSSSVFSHWVNYGQNQHEHTLDSKGQQKRDKMSAQKMGDKLPINDKIKGEISELGARVNYVQWDPGTEPNDQSNLHTHYEEASYQNLRGSGLWGEKIRTLTPFPTNLATFDCIKYLQKDPSANSFVDSRARNGKYLVSGRTIIIKNGHNYSEVIDLFRPYVNNAGASTDEATPATANAGMFKIAAESLGHVGNSLASTPYQLSTVPKSAASSLGGSLLSGVQGLLGSLLNFSSVIPKIPSIPLLTSGANSIVSSITSAQQNVIDALTQIAAVPNSINNMVQNSIAGVNTAALATVQRISSSVIMTGANATIGAIVDGIESGVAGAQGLTDAIVSAASINLEKPLLDRFSESYDNIVNQPITSVLSQANSAVASVGDFIGDINQGGVFVQDLINGGINNATALAQQIGQPVVDAAEHLSNLGTNFILPAAQLGIGGGDVAINPYATASYLADSIALIKNPNDLLANFGPSNYQAMFGDANPVDAFAQLQSLQTLATQVVAAFDPNEVLAGTGVGNILGRASGVVGDVVSGAVDGVQDLFGNVIAPVATAVSAATSVVNTVSNTVSNVSNTVSNVSNAVGNIAGSFTSSIARSIGSFFAMPEEELEAQLTGPIKATLDGTLAPNGKIVGTIKGQVSNAGTVQKLDGTISTTFTSNFIKVSDVTRRIQGEVEGTLNADGSVALNLTSTVLEDMHPDESVNQSKTVLTKPIPKLVNTKSGVKFADEEAALAATENTIGSAKQQFLSDDPTLTVKTSKPAGLSIFSTPAPRKQTANPLIQEFSFQYGNPGLKPLIERVSTKTIDTARGLAIYESVRDPVSWSTYTRFGSKEALAQNSENYWEFPHADPFVRLTEDEGSAYSL
jgi:hypothetical protein